MSGLRDRFPARANDPLHRVRNHVDRRSGAADPARQRRKQRESERAPFVAGGGLTCRRVAGPGTNATVGNQATDTATCSAGEFAVGGGGLSTGTGASTTMIGSQPGDPPTSWSTTFYNDSGSTDTITAYAVCCKAG